ncbi:MAG: hypothetical protein BIFFINMI_00302 [Phycisphaerae bacterium]|nr:hypothetical protein [Phycisphaerae bacterium]
MDVIADPANVKHVWRADLLSKLAQSQQEDGHWVNDADRFEEGHPVVVTCYCMLAIEEVLPAMR